MSDGVNIETLLRSLDDGPQWPCKQAAFTLRGCLDDAELGYACRELGIETVEQLKTRLAPDPRVAVLVEAIDAAYYKFTEDGGPDAGAYSVLTNLHDTAQLIAAQRWEG